MRYLLIPLLVLALLLSGCTIGTPQSPPESPAPRDCMQYCKSQPHTECVGSWSISGTYPDCLCSFECEASKPPADTSSPSGSTPQENQTATAPPQPPANLTNVSSGSPDDEGAGGLPEYFVPTSKTVTQILDQGMSTIRTDFYLNNDGDFSERSYTWKRIETTADPQEIRFSSVSAGEVRFDNKIIDSVAASGFYVFTSKDDDRKIAYGLAIFNDRMTLLDNYTQSDTFRVVYVPPMIARNLTGCSIYSRDYNVNPNQELIITYLFRCTGAS